MRRLLAVGIGLLLGAVIARADDLTSGLFGSLVDDGYWRRDAAGVASGA